MPKKKNTEYLEALQTELEKAEQKRSMSKIMQLAKGDIVANPIPTR